MTQLSTMPNTASVQEIQKNYRKLFDLVKKTKQPLFVLRNNITEVVIVDNKYWHEVAEKIRLQEEKDALSAVAEYKKEKKTGKIKILPEGGLAKLLKK